MGPTWLIQENLPRLSLKFTTSEKSLLPHKFTYFLFYHIV